ncbi:AEC family transporter [Synechococcus elongatus]|uniref:AEC family transporter n=1 Tax=Synechococcus elongatus PCC 11802 TaxID=2283154 RepID=A0AAT9JVE2_SYNEL|nr:AEC family transporter [Synechococcus elongatus]
MSSDILLHAYSPLVVWMGAGLALCRWLPKLLPHLLGRFLFWVGIPLQVFALCRNTDFSQALSISSLVTLAVLLTGLGLATLLFPILRRWQPRWVGLAPDADAAMQAARQGSFTLAAMLGNVGFIGLAVAPSLVSAPYLGWLVLYSVAHNIAGTYGAGVLVASHFSPNEITHSLRSRFVSLLRLPSIWAIALGALMQGQTLPSGLETTVQTAAHAVVPAALVLGGLRLRQLHGWQSLRLALPPVCVRMLVIPLLAGLALTFAGLQGDSRLAMVLQAGMPSGFAGLILAEEYNLDRELLASSILLSTLALFLTLPLWVWLFGTSV